MLSKLLGGTARQTTDIDFSISDSELYKSLIQSFKSVGTCLLLKATSTAMLLRTSLNVSDPAVWICTAPTATRF